MDFNGDYPGSRVKRLKVDTTAEIDGDTTIGGDLHVDGTVDLKEVKTDKVATLDGSVGAPTHTFKVDEKTGMYRDTASGDLRFTRNGVEQIRFASPNTATFSVDTVNMPNSWSFFQARTPELRLTGGTNKITSDTGVHIAPSDTTTVDLSTSETHSIPLIRSDDKVQGTYFTFNEDPDNSRVWYDPDPKYVKISVGGDPACSFYAKTIEGTYSIMDSMTTSSLTATTASMTDGTCSTLSCTSVTATNMTSSTLLCTSASATTLACTSAVVQTLICVSQPFTEFQNTVSQAVTSGVLTTLVVDTTPVVTRASPLVTTNGTVFTIPQSGYYHIEWTVMWSPSSTGYRSAYLRKLPSGTNWGYQLKSAAQTSPNAMDNGGSYTGYLTGGDQLSVFVTQFSASSLNIQFDPATPTRVSFLRLY